MRFSHLLSFTLLASSPLFAATATWNVDSDGNWNVNGNWNPATFPNAIDDIAILGNIITATRTITLGQNITIGTVNFNDNNTYVITSTTGETLTFATSSGSATLVNNNTATGQINSPIITNQNVNVTLNSTGGMSLGGVISGTGSLTLSSVNPATVLSITGISANTLSGTTTLNGGTLELSKTSGINAIAGNIAINSTGTLRLINANQILDTANITLSGGTFNMNGNAETIGSLTFNSGTMVQTGTETLTLSNTSADITPALTMRNVTIPGNIAISNGGTIVFDITNNGTATINGSVDLGSVSPTVNVGQGSNLIDMQWNGVVSGSQGFTKMGSGRLYFSGPSPNTYTGLTTINGGTLFLNKTAGVSSVIGNIALNAGALTADTTNQMSPSTVLTQTAPATFNINADQTFGSYIFTSGAFVPTGTPIMTLTSSGTALSLGPAKVITTPVVISNGGTINMDGNSILSGDVSLLGGGQIAFVGASATGLISGNLDLGPITPTVTVAQGLAIIDMQFSGIVSSSTPTTGITKMGSGRLYLTGTAANTYTGLTTVNGGTLFLQKDPGVTAVNGDILLMSALTWGANEQVANTANITQNAGNLNIDTFTETVNSYTFNGGTYVQNGGLLILNSGGTPLTMRNTNITGNLRLANGGTVVFDSLNNGTGRISGNLLDLNGNPVTFNVSDGSASTDMDISAEIFNSSGVTKTGLGTLAFSGGIANSYTGVTTVSNGVLSLSKTAGINAITGNVTIDGGTLSLGASNQINDSSIITQTSGGLNLNDFSETIPQYIYTGGTATTGTNGVLTLTNANPLQMNNTTLSGNVILANGGTVLLNGTSILSGGTFTLNSTTSFNVGNTSTISDILEGNGGLTKIGAGTLTLSNSANNSYLGTTTVSDGTLLLSASSGLNAIPGNVTINGGMLSLGASDQIIDASVITQTSGSLALNDFSETISQYIYTGGAATTGANGLLTLTDVNPLQMNNTTLGGNVTLANGGTVLLNGTSVLSGGTLTLDATTSFNVGGSANISDIIDGVGGLIKIGAGTLEIGGTTSNTFTGLTTVTTGILLLSKTAGLDAISGDVAIDGGTLNLGASDQIIDSSIVTVTSGAFNLNNFDEDLGQLNYSGGTVSLGTGMLTLNNSVPLIMADTTLTGNVTIANGGVALFTGTTAFNGGTLTLDETTIFDVTNALTISDSIDGNGGLTKLGVGTLTFSGVASNSYLGITTISNGTLVLSKTAGLDAIAGDILIDGGTLSLAESDQISDSSIITQTSGSLNLNDFSEAISQYIYTGGTVTTGTNGLLTLIDINPLEMNNTTLNGNATLANGGTVLLNGTSILTGGTLTLDDTTSFNVGSTSTISDVIDGSGGLTKTGVGTLEITGTTSNTYTGLTTVSAGILLLDKTAGLNAIFGDVTINGGTLSLGASNQIDDSSVITQTSGTLALNDFSETISQYIYTGGTATTGSNGLLTLTDVNPLEMNNTTLSGNVTLANGGTVLLNGTSILSGGTLTLDATTSFNTVGSSTISDIIDGNGGLTKTGIGTLEIAGATSNAYAGLTTVSSGILLLHKTAGLDAISGDITINGGTLSLGASDQIDDSSMITQTLGSLNLNDFSETISQYIYTGGTATTGSNGLLTLTDVNPLEMNNTTLSGNVKLANGGTVLLNGPSVLSGGTLTLDATTSFNVAGTSTISDVIDGVGGLTKIGAGTLEISGTANNNYEGLTTVSTGILLLNKTSGLDAISGNVTIDGGSLSLGAAEQIDDSSVIMQTSGVLTLNDFSETVSQYIYTGGTATTGTNGLLTLTDANPLQMNDTTLSGNVTLANGGTVLLSGTSILNGGILTLDDNTSFNVASTSTISDIIAGSGGLAKIGAGTLEISGTANNTYEGLTSVSSGILLLNKTDGLDAILGDITINGGMLSLDAYEQIDDSSIITQTSGTLDLNDFSETISQYVYTGGTATTGINGLLTLTDANPLQMNNTTLSGNVTLANGGTVLLDGTSILSGGTLTLGNATAFNVGISSIISDIIEGSGGLTKTGIGTLAISGTASNTYAGLTTVTAGILLLNKTDGLNAISGNVTINGGTISLGASNQIIDSSIVSISSGAFNFNDFDESIDQLNYSGGIVSLGEGTLTLNNIIPLIMSNTTLTGNVTIANGGTAFFSGTTVLNGGILTLGATTSFDVTNTLTISDTIIGAGGLTKLGGGTLELSGTASNSYLGTTTVSGGTLVLDKSAGIDTTSENVFINGGTLLWNASQQIPNNSIVTLSSGLLNMSIFSENIASLIFHGGNFAQNGGILTLSDATTAMAMRNTTLSGNLVISNGGSIVFDPINNGTAILDGTLDLGGFLVDFDIGDGSATPDMLISSNITNGSINKIGNGWLQLTGENAFSFPIIITAGLLEGNTQSLTNDIINNSQLIFLQNFNGTYAGSLSGTGTLLKRGTASLIFSNVNTLQGLTTVEEGSFIVNGTFGGAGELIVNSQALLGGIGIIAKSTMLFGTLNPGSNPGSISTLNFIGDISFEGGSILSINLDPNSSDLVGVEGSVTIESDTTLDLNPLPGNYEGNLFYTIVSTTDGVNGEFTTVTSSLPLFTSFVTYSPNEIFLQGFFAPFSDVFTQGNAGAISNALDVLNQPSGSDLAIVINALRLIDSADALEEALLQLQPSAFTSLALAQEANTFYIKNTITNRLDERLHSCHHQCEPGYHFWIAPIFGYSDQNDVDVLRALDTEPGYQARTFGIFVGVDQSFSSCRYFGGGFGYTYTDLTWKRDRGDANIHSAYAALYGRLETSNSYLQGTLLGAYNIYAIHRNIEFSDIHRTAFSNHEGVEGSIDIEGGFIFHVYQTILSPFVCLNYMYLNEDNFIEKNADSLNLYIQSKNSDLLTSEFGIDISRCSTMFANLTPFLQASVIRESRFKGSLEQGSFCPCFGNSSMNVYGLNPSRTLAGLTMGITSTNDNPFFSFFYRGKYGNRFHDHSATIEFKF